MQSIRNIIQRPSSRRTILKAGAGLAAASVLGGRSAFAQQQDVPLTLEFRTYGGNAPLYYGVKQGIFSDLGLNVSLEGSSGSGEAVRRVASGGYDIGMADASTLMAFAATNPDVAPKIVMTIFDRFPAVILGIGRKPLTSLESLLDMKVGWSPASASSKVLPALLSLNNINADDIDFTSIDVKIRDTLLLKGEVDAVIAFDYTAIFNLMDNGVPQEDIQMLYYSDYGFDFWGNSMIASPKIIEENPELVKQVAIATAKSWVAAESDREAAIEAVVEAEPLLNGDIELKRMNWVYDKHILTPNVLEHGFGDFGGERAQRNFDLLSEGFGIQMPSVDSIYGGDALLPPLADRSFT